MKARKKRLTRKERIAQERAHQKALARRRERDRVRREAKRAEARRREARKLALAEKRSRMRTMKAQLRPLLAAMVREVSEGRGVKAGLASRETHARYYDRKMAFAVLMGRTEYEAVLEALSDDLDLDDLGWDIIY